MHLAQRAHTQYQFDETLLLLATANVDKGVVGASLPQRLHMMSLVAQAQPSTSVGTAAALWRSLTYSDLSVFAPVCSFARVCVCTGVTAHGRFVDKATALRAVYGPQCEIFLLMGFDTIVRVFNPKYYSDLHAAMGELFGCVYCVPPVTF